MTLEEIIKAICDSIIQNHQNLIDSNDIFLKLIEQLAKENKEKDKHIIVLYIGLIILSVCVYLKQEEQFEKIFKKFQEIQKEAKREKEKYKNVEQNKISISKLLDYLKI